MLRRTLAAAACGLALGAAPAAAHAPDDVVPAPRATADEPPLVAVPRAGCAPGSRPEPDIQGRVPAGGAGEGYACNLSVVGRHGGSGGYKALRYVDRAGRECGYYDTTLLFPLNVLKLSGPTAGVAVLDMSDPARPAQTDTLATPAMLSPHESLELNRRRGLLAAVTGNPAFHPGWVDVYDVSADCRRPRLLSSLPAALLGHESGFAPDGRTFYATSIGLGVVTAVDLDEPKVPRPLWVGNYKAHGTMVSDDGNRLYVAAREGLLILDVSEVQARRPNPQVREVSRLAWSSMTIPQVAIPVTIEGRPYLVEVDEFSGEEGSERAAANGPRVGAARIIDISDERAPRVVSNIRLAVHQPENRAAIAGDPGAQSRLQGYAAHYCNVPRRVDPGILACSFIVSGLRVFDIREPRHPREIAYFVAPRGEQGLLGEGANWAMSRPDFASDRREIWYSDGNSGFFALRLRKQVWP